MSDIKMGDKLYVITRSDLSPGQQAVQGMHALQEFAIEYPDVNRLWHANSNYLAFLCVADDEELGTLFADAMEANVEFSLFREPDRNNELTALCLAPGPKTTKLCKGLRLALR